MTGVKISFGRARVFVFTAILLCSILAMSLIMIGENASAQADGNSDSDDEEWFFASTACCGAWIVSVIIGVIAAKLVYDDAEKRKEEGWVYALGIIVASMVFPYIGILIVVVIWLFVRPDWDSITHPGASRPIYPPRYPPQYPPQYPQYPPPQPPGPQQPPGGYYQQAPPVRPPPPPPPQQPRVRDDDEDDPHY